MVKKYEYLYDDKKKGYHLDPENTDILNLLPKESKSLGLTKICKKNDLIYIFFIKDKVQKQDREADNSILIYEISDIEEISKIEELKEIIQKLENHELSEKEKENILFCLREKNYSFIEDIVPFFILKYFDLGEVCFKKVKELHIELNDEEKCILNKFDEIKNYYEYLKTKNLKKIFKCLNEQRLIELLDECRRDVYLKAKEYGLNLQQIVLDKTCVELKKSLLHFVIEKGDEKAINKLYKSLNYKIFIGI